MSLLTFLAGYSLSLVWLAMAVWAIMWGFAFQAIGEAAYSLSLGFVALSLLFLALVTFVAAFTDRLGLLFNVEDVPENNSIG